MMDRPGLVPIRYRKILVRYVEMEFLAIPV
jgi:hypothetical protein